MATLTVSTRRIMATRIMVGRITVARSASVNMGIMQLGTNGVRNPMTITVSTRVLCCGQC